MKTRVISSVVMLAIAGVCVFLSPVTRILFFAVVGGLCAYEFSVSVEKLEAKCTLWVMLVYLAAQGLLVFFDAGLFWYAVCFVFCVYLALFSGVIHKNVAGKGALFTLAGLSYPCLLAGLIMAISVSDIWALTLILACLSTWVCDSFALFGGKRFGRHKVAPSVSPNKTVEGCLCGAAFSLLAGVAVFFLAKLITPLPLGFCLASALICSSMGQIGDLAESLMKRMIGVKDFGNLIPGHGGMFDRADSLMFSIPTAYLCLMVTGLAA